MVYTSSPHMAGTKEDWSTVEYTKQVFEESFPGQVTIDEHNVLLTYPLGASLSMKKPVPFQAKIREDVVASDPTSADSRISFPFNGYSRSGSLTGKIMKSVTFFKKFLNQRPWFTSTMAAPKTMLRCRMLASLSEEPS